MASQDKEQVPWWDGKSKTWDLDKTKVRIYVDKTKWQKRYQHGPRLTQRAGAGPRYCRRVLCGCSEGCHRQVEDWMTLSVLCWCCSVGAKQFPEDPCHCEDFGAECCYQSPHPGSKRLRRPAFPAVEGCRPGGRSSKNGVEKLMTRVTKKVERKKRMIRTT